MIKRIWTWLVFPAVLVAGLSLSQCNTQSPKFKQYLVEGERLYIQHCSNCHQADGKGLGRVYPPLAPSEFMNDNFETVICSIKFGMSREIVVNGEVYNQPMPGIPSLTELEIAEIATYIYNSWGHDRGLIGVNYMTSILEGCQSADRRK